MWLVPTPIGLEFRQRNVYMLKGNIELGADLSLCA